MRRTVLSGFILVMAAASQPDTRQAYEQALREWQQAEAGLDVPNATPGEVLQRLKDVETKRSAVTAARERYYDEVRKRHGSPLSNAAPTRFDTRAAAAVGRDTAADLASDLDGVARELKTTSPAAVLRLSLLRQRRDGLKELRDLYTSRQKALEQLAALDGTLDDSRAALAENYARSVAAIEAQGPRLEASKKSWSERYESIRRTAISRAAAAVPAPVSSPATIPTRTAVAPPHAPRDLTGKWILIAPRAEKYADAKGPLYGDVSVLVQIAQSGGQLSGVYNGVVFVPPNESYNPNVNFRFVAPASNAPVLEGRIESPLSGTVKIAWVDDNRIRVSYQIARTAKAAGISFKEGGVKELRRQ